MQIGKQFVVSTHVDQNLNNRRTELLWELLANPANKDDAHAYNLQQLATDFPQSGILQALLSYTGDNNNLSKAAAYYNPKLLYKLSNDPDGFPVVSPGQILNTSANVKPNGFFHAEEEHLPENTGWVPLIDTDHLIEPYVEGSENLPAAAEHNSVTEELPAFGSEFFQETEELPAIEQQPVTEEAASPEAAIEPEPEISAEPLTGELPVVTAPEIIADAEPQQEEAEETETIPEPVLVAETPEPELIQSIDDEIYDEIVGIDDINLEQEFKPFTEAVTETETEFAQAEEEAEEDIPVAETAPKPEPASPAVDTDTRRDGTLFNARRVDLNDEAEKLILNNIAATDFFVYDRAFGERKKVEELETPAPKIAVAVQPVLEEKKSPAADVHQDVSRYHDEKMPYSFMWWLDKTRKEHAATYQPYVEFKLDTTQSISKDVPDELQHQYYENIFHLTSVEELERSTAEQAAPLVFDPKKKEDEIIERFIQEVPQIKPQSGDKLDNENKARKSSEDQDALVTETLALVYADQMLYPKAIATYKKLMLKFPEKSRYFAGQIEQLEKKTS